MLPAAVAGQVDPANVDQIMPMTAASETAVPVWLMIF
jgi:hypothetical protein